MLRRQSPRIAAIAAIAAFALLAGCSGAPERPVAVSQSVPWPEFAPPKPGDRVYRIDTDSSELRIRVDPEGPMARFGHSHIIGGNVISGSVVLGDAQHAARLDLRIDTSSLDVDRPQWRADAGLDAALDPDAISGTRSNMRSDRVLDSVNHPAISIRSVGVEGPTWLSDVTVRIRIRGNVSEVTVPVAVEFDERRLTASGATDLLQSDFGIEPFSAAGGALRVSDRMQIRFRIVAEERSLP